MQGNDASPLRVGEEEGLRAPDKDGTAYLRAFSGAESLQIPYRTGSTEPVAIAAYGMTGRVVALVKDRAVTAGVRRITMPGIGDVVCIRMSTPDREWGVGRPVVPGR